VSPSLRILFVTPYVPSPVRIRPFAFIRELWARGHQVVLACLVQPAWEGQYLSEVRQYCQAVYPVFPSRIESYLFALSSLPTRTPLSVAYCRSEPFDRLVGDLVQREQFDVLHTEFVRAAPVTTRLNGLPKVYDAVDSLGLAYRRSLTAAHISPPRRIIALFEWMKMRRYETQVLSHYDRLLVSSPMDQQALQNAKKRVTVIPNGVDTDYFRFHQGNREPETIVFLGKMNYYVNVSSVLWFYREVFPLIRRERPGARFKIVGRSPSPEISRLAADPAVEVTGTVPDVRPHLASATVAVVPMVSGAGIQNKMLEAMAIGTPCVSTSLACQALQTEQGHDVLVSDTAEGFAASVLTLLEHHELRNRLAYNGRCYVDNYHTWGKIGERLNDVYDSLYR
jgi:sugar transferase (PEP-CTERM/EpsH1 system associated)